MDGLRMVSFLGNVVPPGEKSICVLVKDPQYLTNLNLNNNGGVSTSGVWKLNRNRMVGMKNVVIYSRKDGINKIIVGKYNDISQTIFQGKTRYYLHFQIQNKFQTLNNWKDFCNTGQNPVRYFP